MKARTFTFKTGRPVAPQGFIAFLTTEKAQKEHAEHFAVQQAKIEAIRNSRVSTLLEDIIGLAGM